MSRGATFGPAYSTALIEMGAGAEMRIAQWQYSLGRGVISFEERRPEMALALQAFFEAREGQYRGFRFWDPNDHDTIDLTTGLDVPQPLAPIPGNANLYQLQKVYSDGVRTQARKITKPIANTLGDTAANAGNSSIRVYQNGSEIGFSCDTTTGLVTIGSYGGTVSSTPTLEHYYPLNELGGTTAFDNAGSVNGTLSGAILVNQPGHGGSGTSMLFEGGSITFPSLLVPNDFSAWTVDGWFNASILGGTIIKIADSNQIYIDSSGLVWLTRPSSNPDLLMNASNTAPIHVGEWHYFFVCYDGTASYNVGIDSFLGGSGGGNPASGSTVIGSGSHGDFHGYLQDIAFYFGGSNCVTPHYTIPGLAATYQFHTPCRFASDLQQIQEGSGLFYNWSRVELQEIRIPNGLLINP
jgi:uncharacterized protein (TIGR02217 family)